jgi:hypothetical protein
MSPTEIMAPAAPEEPLNLAVQLRTLGAEAG